MNILTKHTTANNPVLKIVAGVLFILFPVIGFVLVMQFQVTNKQMKESSNWVIYKGKYITFKYPKKWSINVKEDVFTSDGLPGFETTKVKGPVEIIIYDQKGNLFLKIKAINGIGGICEDYFVFKDSKMRYKEIKKTTEDRLNFKPNVILIETDINDIGTFMAHRVRYVPNLGGADEFFIDIDKNTEFFDNKGCFLAEYSDDLYLWLQSNGKQYYKVNTYLLKRNKNFSLNEIPIMKEILQSFNVYNKPVLEGEETEVKF